MHNLFWGKRSAQFLEGMNDTQFAFSQNPNRNSVT